MTEVKFTIDIETDMMTIAKGVADSNCLDGGAEGTDCPA